MVILHKRVLTYWSLGDVVMILKYVIFERALRIKFRSNSFEIALR